MGKKCSVVNCRSGYDTVKDKDEKPPTITIYRFPKDEEECRRWISCLPNKLDRVTEYMGVCALHWPFDTPLIRKNRGRYPVPTVPPSIFPNVPKSSIPTHTSCTPRTTKNALSSARQTDYDQLSLFRQVDSLKADTFTTDFKEKFSSVGLILSCDKYIALFSTERTGNVHIFSIYVNYTEINSNSAFTITVELYHQLKRIIHPSINGVINCWSKLEELVRFIKQYDCGDDAKLDFITNSVRMYNSPKNTRIYSLQDLSLAFSWYSRSRALYQTLRSYIQLPSLSTLKKLTRVAKNTDDVKIFKSIFSQLDERSRGCIIIIDEIYVKASITYRGGCIFGYSEDYPDKLATTFLCVMVKCFFGSKSFLCRLIPCHALKADFQFNVVCSVISLLEDCGAKVLALLCDNNRMNQRFFSLFHAPDPVKPWIVDSPSSSASPLFLIYDPVHIIKNIRNSWLTEKQKVLHFDHEGSTKTARWSDLQVLFDFEANHMLKRSSLTKSSVQPNNVEKQKVSLALQVFSTKTSSALKAATISSESFNETALFIDEVLRLWKVFNCKTPYQSIFFQDPKKSSVNESDSGQDQIEILLHWADMARKLEPTTAPRIGSLTRDTAKAIQWTCHSLISIRHYLLTVDAPFVHKYVTFGFFQQDDIERHFGHFRMSAGNSYYITAQDIMNTHAIDKTKLMLECMEDLDINLSNSCHSCSLCTKPLTDAEILLIDDLPVTVFDISNDEKMSLIYIGGYICQKHKDCPLLQGDSSSYPELSSFTDNLNRGGLFFPSNVFFQVLCYMFSFFRGDKEQSCRKRLLKIFSDFPAIFHLDLSLPEGSLRRIINIFFKNFCLQQVQQNQSSRRKIAKLSSSAQ